ncbi:MAG TPA: sigma-70 family RNA polymerase sigma factor [Candidatus Acidoferrales bacterium]
MAEQNWLAGKFEENRGHLRAVAYRMLGSATEADDAVQEAWLRLSRTNAEGIENLGGWLTTVVSHVCLDMLRSRKSRSEEPISAEANEAPPKEIPAKTIDPESEAILADSVGLALLVVLDRLAPAERLAFVLHDMFAVPFEEIAEIVGRTPEATRQLASRARRRVQGAPVTTDATRSEQRKLVDAFLAALRAGDLEGLVAVLDPDMVFRADAASAVGGAAREIHGAEVWAHQAMLYSRGARHVQAAMVDGSVGLILAPGGRLLRALKLKIENGKIKEVEVIGEKEHLAQIELAVLEN